MAEQMKWHQELDVFYRIKSGIILEGNVADRFFYAEDNAEVGMVGLRNYLQHFFQHRGYRTIVYYDMLNHFTDNDSQGHQPLNRFAELCGVRMPSADKLTYPLCADGQNSDMTAPELIATAMQQRQEPVVIVMDMASRYIIAPDRMQLNEIHAFTRLQSAIASGVQAKGQLRNLLIFITNKQNDLPAWFFLNNPTLMTVELGLPSAKERRALLADHDFLGFWEHFPRDFQQMGRQIYATDPAGLNRLVDKLVARTEGYTNLELNDLKALCRLRKIPVSEVCSVVDLYAYGIKDNPWQDAELREKLRNGRQQLQGRVKGQWAAISQVMDVITRSVVGLSISHGKPKGILFFAGPTGTGKTETAKSLAELIFGDESNCIRFDMSEYSQSHSDQRLLGAPPGYVGYEAGGQLTNAVRQRPFSILLFDEIEKASPSILDKFLQILEDGRMTDGQGRTVYFSETVIIFTSNLGIYTTDEAGNRVLNVTPDMAYGEVSERVRNAIGDYFKLQLGRPEILNRIGDNIVVFGFITRDIAEEILRAKMKKLHTSMLEEHGWTVTVEDHVFNALLNSVKLDNGGRGVMNALETGWINPLSRWLFEHNVSDNVRIRVVDIDMIRTPVTLKCEVQ